MILEHPTVESTQWYITEESYRRIPQWNPPMVSHRVTPQSNPTVFPEAPLKFSWNIFCILAKYLYTGESRILMIIHEQNPPGNPLSTSRHYIQALKKSYEKIHLGKSSEGCRRNPLQNIRDWLLWIDSLRIVLNPLLSTISSSCNILTVHKYQNKHRPPITMPQNIFLVFILLSTHSTHSQCIQNVSYGDYAKASSSPRFTP